MKRKYLLVTLLVLVSTIMTLPIIFLFQSLEKFLEKGLVAGGVKG